jgi:hypothetical protein
MGAYENPPIIKVPNFAEIFNRNFMPGLKAGIAKQQKREALEAQQQAAIKKQQIEEAKQRKIAQGKSLEYTEKFQEKISKIKGGSLEQGLQEEASGMTDDFFKNESDYANGLVDFETYSAKRLSLNRAIDTMAGFGNSMVEFEKSLEKIDVSNYQDNEELIGLISAWKEGKIRPSYDEETGELELIYKAGGKIIEVNQKWLTNPESWTVNQKFDSKTFLSEASDSIADQVFDSQIQKVEGDVTSTVVTKVWKPGYENEQKRFETFLNSGIINNLSDKELGSYYMDNLAGNVPVDDPDLKAALSNYKLNDKQKTAILSAVDLGEFVDEKEVGGTAEVIMDFAKRKLARQAVAMANEKSPEGLVKESTKVSETKPTVKEKSIQKGIDNYLKNPLTEEEWNNVKGDNLAFGPQPFVSDEQRNQDLYASFRQFSSKYDLEFVKPVPSFDKKKEVGFEFKDNNTGKKIYIDKNYTYEQVLQEILRAKNIENTGDNNNEPVVFDGSN